MATKVTVKSAATDGTNIFLEVEIFNGTYTLPMIRPVFPEGTSAAKIQTYLSNIATNAPALTSAVRELVGYSVTV